MENIDEAIGIAEKNLAYLKGLKEEKEELEPA